MNVPQTTSRLTRELLAFLRSHWLHVLFAAPGALLVTVAHEAAHCAAALVQGGTVTEFVWLPGGGYWGHMRYEFPQGVRYSSFAVSIAPYVFWLLVAAWVAVAFMALASIVLGFLVQRRLYRERRLSARAYAVLCAIAVLGIGVVSGALSV